MLTVRAISTLPVPEMEENPLSAVHDYLFNLFRANFHIHNHNFMAHQVVVTRGQINVTYVILVQQGFYLGTWVQRAGITQSVLRFPTGWTVRGSNPGGARLSTPVQTGPGAHPASHTMSTGSFPGINSGRGVPFTTHAGVKERVELYLYSPCGPSWSVIG